MKTFLLTFIAAAFLSGNIGISQTASSVANSSVSPSTPYSIVEQDANDQIWERTVYEPGPNGSVVARQHRYTELCTGLNFWQNGQWQASREEIDLLPTGQTFAAAATKGQHQAWFPLDIAQGVIDLLTPDGTLLESRPVGLFFEDDSNSALIAILTNSVGELVASNQVIYPNAFEGAAASVRYRYTRSGFEQDVIVQGQLPDPATLGLDPARTRLGVLTAFFDTNNPVATPGPTDTADGLSDSTLTFGSMKMAQGRAFVIGDAGQTPLPTGGSAASWQNWITNAAQQSSAGGTPTFKRWFQLNGHNFLMEEVPYQRVAPQLDQLPPMTGRLNGASTNLYAANSLLDGVPNRLLSPPARGGAASQSQRMRLVKADENYLRGLVLDYVTVPASPGNYTFQSDTTYYVSGECDLNDVAFEGGTVIKYANVNSLTPVQIGAYNYGTAFLVIEGGVVTNKTSSYRPAVFTACDDDTVGQQISGSTGNPSGNYYANPAIYFENNSGFTLSNACVRYAAQAFYLLGQYYYYYGSGLTLSDVQVTDSGEMAVLGAGYGSDGPITLTCNNCLYNGGTLAIDYGTVSDTYNLTNCTIDNVYYLIYGSNPSYCYGNAVNCIFANTSYLGYNVSWQGSYNGFYSSATFGSSQYTTGSSPFQTVGAGSCYLASNTFRGVGTTNISSSIRADLAAKTTYPPIVYSNVTISTATTFSPQAGRDNAGSEVDLGYHYVPIDYFFGGVVANSNVTFIAGTACGWFELPGSGGPGYGLSLSNGVFATFTGTATAPCVFARYDTVQEGGDGLWQDKGWLGGMEDGGIYHTNNPAGLTATFTHFYSLAADPNHFRDGVSNQPIVVQAEHCEFYESDTGYNILAGYTNCLFYRAGFGISNALAYPYQKYINCTFYGGSLSFGHSESGAPYWYSYIHDCAFDGTTFSIGDPFGSNTNDADYNYNAFDSGAAQPPTEGAHTVSVTGGINWQSSWFGNYYLPSGSSLINAGDRTADKIGLYHFTMLTSQVPETNSVVDIGYHYVATGTNGVPLDANGDGIPDYLEDANGNGLVDSGEIGWNIVGDPGLSIIITQPNNGSTLP